MQIEYHIVVLLCCILSCVVALDIRLLICFLLFWASGENSFAPIMLQNWL